MKTQTLSTSARRGVIAAALFCAAALPSLANSNWKGKTDNDFGTADNWDNGVPTIDTMVIDKKSFDSRFTENEIAVDDYYENSVRAVIRNVGTAEAPLVLRATAADKGVQFGNSPGGNNSVLNIANANGHAYLRLVNGTWSTGAGDMLIGSANYAGYVMLKDVNSFSVGTYLNLANGSFTLDGGSVTLSGGNANYHKLGGDNKTATFTIEKGSVVQTGNTHFDIGDGAGSTATMTVKSGGSFSSTLNSLYMGRNSPGTLNIQGGTVTLVNLTYYVSSSDSAAAGSAVNITEGGVLETKSITVNKDYTSTLNLDGGTLRFSSNATGGVIANNNSNFDFTVGSNGGTIEYQGSGNIRINQPIGGAGHMTFKGSSGGIKFNTSDPTGYWTGGTTIELNASSAPLLYFAGSNTKAALLDGTGGLVIDGKNRASDGTGIAVLAVESNGTLTEDDLAKVHFVNCGDGTVARLDNDKIVVDFVAPAWELAADTTWSSLVATYGAPAEDATVTIKADTDCTLTIDQNATIGELVFQSSGSVTLAVSSDQTLTVGDITGAGAISNSGTIVKTGSGTATIPFNNASTGVVVVDDGTLKVASKAGEGTNYVVRVKGGATYDVNGVGEVTVNVILEKGAFFTNTGSTIDSGTKQTVSLTLEGDATVTATNGFGLVGPSSAATTINLGTYTLTVGGTGQNFDIDNTTINGTGKILVVDGGRLRTQNNASAGENCSLELANNAKLGLARGLSVKNFVNNSGRVTEGGSVLTVTGKLTPGGDIVYLTLANGATVKASATAAQVVSKRFAASGTVKIDASDIPAATLKDATDGIPVLTVPVGASTDSVTWQVTGADSTNARARWVEDDGGTTKTLRLFKPTGLILIFW